MQLSETALGHAKLSELLKHERLRDVCHLRLEDVGYVVAAGPHPHFTTAAAWQDSDAVHAVVGRESKTEVSAEVSVLPVQVEVDDDEEEDYDAAADLLYSGGLHESLCGSECPWGATPEHSFNEADRQASVALAQTLAAIRLSTLVEATKSEDGSTEGGESSDDLL